MSKIRIENFIWITYGGYVTCLEIVDNDIGLLLTHLPHP